MRPNQRDSERCDTCRFWHIQTRECHRHAPVLTLEIGLRTARRGDATAGVWPRTQAGEWCGEWAMRTDQLPARHHSSPGSDEVAEDAEVAIRVFLGRVAPGMETRNPVALIVSLLNQL